MAQEKESKVRGLVQALAKSGVDNPQINQFVLNAFFKEMLAEDKGGDRDSLIREAIGGRLLEEENPNFLLIKEVLGGGNLDEIFAPTPVLPAAQQERISQLLDIGDTAGAEQVSQLQPGQFKKFLDFDLSGSEGRANFLNNLLTEKSSAGASTLNQPVPTSSPTGGTTQPPSDIINVELAKRLGQVNQRKTLLDRLPVR